MGDLTNNFSRSEFACSCGECKQVAVDYELLTVLQDAVDDASEDLGYPVSCKITSGNRCKESNIKALMQYSNKTREEAEKSGSMHLFSMAADIKLFNKNTGEQIPAESVSDYFEDRYPDKYGIGRYHNRTHIDTRPNKARWG